jgi:DNA-binding transcriptional MerR regulator
MELISINSVADKLGLSVHQLRRWELMFGLEIRRGRGQQRQYRVEDLSVLERVRELVEQGWPTTQIRPQLEAEGLLSPKLIGMPNTATSPEILMESVVGLRNFSERRLLEISKQIDELRQLLITVTLKHELGGEVASQWQPVSQELLSEAKHYPAEEIEIGPTIESLNEPPQPQFVRDPPQARAKAALGEVTDQNYLTVLGRALDMVGWTDEEADGYCQKSFGIEHWDELGRSQAETLISHLISKIESRLEEEDQIA